jgi:hypothetical protein
LEDRNQLLPVLVGILDLLAEPLVVSTGISRQPSSGSVLLLVIGLLIMGYLIWPWDLVVIGNVMVLTMLLNFNTGRHYEGTFGLSLW